MVSQTQLNENGLILLSFILLFYPCTDNLNTLNQYIYNHLSLMKKYTKKPLEDYSSQIKK